MQTRKGKKKGGITDELLDSLPAVEVVLVSEAVQAEPEINERKKRDFLIALQKRHQLRGERQALHR
jgi:hypothetical protein